MMSSARWTLWRIFEARLAKYSFFSSYAALTSPSIAETTLNMSTPDTAPDPVKCESACGGGRERGERGRERGREGERGKYIARGRVREGEGVRRGRKGSE